MILLIDNYDSFTYNIVQELGMLGADVKVVKNDEFSVDEIENIKFDSIIFSPGPGNPDSAGVTLAAIKKFAGKVPMFGVCLGHQSIAQAFGGKVVSAKRLMHGKTSRIHHDGKGVFKGMPQDFEAMRYHSLAVERESLPDCLEISAVADDGEIMGLRHKTLPIESVQYHPESIGTPEGLRQLQNFLDMDMASRQSRSSAVFGKFRRILSGEMAEDELRDMLLANRGKKVDVDELVAAAKAMREAGARIDLGDIDALDIVGTGGDGLGTFNVSTTAAFVAAGAGVTIAKHGNVGATSKCGAADVLAALGYDLEQSPEQVAALIREIGIGFLFAKKMHPAMRFAAKARKELGFKTIFNLLGPLTNPAGVKNHLIGVYDPSLCRPMAIALKELGSKRAIVVSGKGGLDEVSPCGESLITILNEGKIIEKEVKVALTYGEEFGIDEIGGGDAQVNAKLLRAVLDGSDRGARRAVAIENAATAIMVAGLTDDFKRAISIAAESIDSGKALEKLELMTGAK